MSLLLEDPRHMRAYVEKQAQRQTLWGFEHIPKTAGSALISTLSKQAPPYFNIAPESYDVPPGTDYRGMMRQSSQKFIDLQAGRPEGQRFRCFSGHLFREHLDQIRNAFPDVRYFTLLREPVERAISDYRYCLTPAHPTHLEFARKYPAFADYLQDAAYQNVMTKMLAAPRSAINAKKVVTMTPAEVFDAVFPCFEFVGVQEFYPESVEIALAMMGVTGAAAPARVNVTARTESNQLDVDAELRRQIRAANSLDVALYEEVVRRLVPHLEAWRGDAASSPGAFRPPRAERGPAPRGAPEPVRPLFILGAPRSGTTQMLRLCRDVFGHNGAPEGHVWQSLTALDDHFERIERELAAGTQAGVGGFAIRNFTRTKILSRYAATLLEMHAETYGGPLVVDKTVGEDSVRAAPLILKALPDAKFIFMRRRGVENVLSQMRRFPHMSFVAACADWARAMAAWRDVRGALGERALEIDQRDLAVAPEAVAQELTRFLGAGRVDETIDYMTKHFPEKTTKGDYDRYLAFRAAGWDSGERQTFSKVCGEMMNAYGYSFAGERALAPSETLDLAAAPHLSHWRVENANKWISLTGPGLRLHPSPPDKPSPVLRFPVALLPGEYRFDAEIVVFEAKCRSHKIEIDFGEAAQPGILDIWLDGSKQGRVVWASPKIEVARPANVELTVALEKGLADAQFSATQIVSLTFTRVDSATGAEASE